MSKRSLERGNGAVTATITGSVTATAPVSNTATRTAVPFDDAAPGVVLLAANANRLGATVYNNSDGSMFLALGAVVATLTDFTVKLVPGAYYEVPYNFRGQLSAIWEAATTAGDAQVTELT